MTPRRSNTILMIINIIITIVVTIIIIITMALTEKGEDVSLELWVTLERREGDKCTVFRVETGGEGRRGKIIIAIRIIIFVVSGIIIMVVGFRMRMIIARMIVAGGSSY